MTNSSHVPPALVRTAVAVGVAAGVAVLLASCTSGGDPAPTSGPTSTAATTVAPPSSAAPSSTTPAGLDRADGALLVLGSSRGKADLYRVDGARIVRVTRSANISAVSTGDNRTVVGVEGPGERESVEQVRGSQLVDLDAEGFDPALSSTGALARVRLESGSTTPGISKPRGFALVVRTTPQGRDRVVLTQRESMGSPRWVDRFRVVVAVAGDTPHVVVVDIRTGTRRDLGGVEGAGDLDLTASSRDLAVTTDDGGVLLNVDDRNQHTFPSGWTPLCWPTGSSVLAAKDGQLATVVVNHDGSADPPQLLGSLPNGTSAFAATCGSG